MHGSIGTFGQTANIPSDIEAAREEFDFIVEGAKQLVDQGKDRQAVERLRLAADFAHIRHTGKFSSVAIEQLLDSIGQRSVAGSHTSRRSAENKRILHVLTTALPIRGTSRMIWRLVNADPDSIRSHSVVATNQRNHPLPTDLPEALGKRDGELRVLDSGRRALEKAKDLRALAQNFDTVILHIDPADVIPSLAFAGRTAELGPKVMMYNQMDHTFWIGGAISDGVANAREAGARLSVERRGLHPGRMLTLPLIIADTQREQSRDEAKRALGIPPTSTVILTAAMGYKYATTDGPTFFDVVTPVLRQNEDVILLACGPVRKTIGERQVDKPTDE